MDSLFISEKPKDGGLNYQRESKEKNFRTSKRQYQNIVRIIRKSLLHPVTTMPTSSADFWDWQTRKN